MLRYILAFIILVHGLIHLMGFANAFELADMKQLSISILKPVGVAWLVTALIFVVAVIFFLLKKEYWWMPALVAIVISQVVIIMGWKDAKFGTIANVIILIAAILSWGSSRFENAYRKDVSSRLQSSKSISMELLTTADLKHLPAPVQRYLEYAGVLNKPKVKNVRIVFEGQMREKGKDYFPFVSEQYNFFDEPTRLFFMKAKMFGVTVPGYHRYINTIATMDVRLFGLIPVVQKSGEAMSKAETVTLFNDMCLLAPASLIDKRIQWETVDSLSAKASFTNQGITVTATLFFNAQRQLINFLSNDRHAPGMGGEFPFSTPVHGYQQINGFQLMNEGDAVWHYTDGEFVYGKFYLKSIQYNVSQ